MPIDKQGNIPYHFCNIWGMNCLIINLFGECSTITQPPKFGLFIKMSIFAGFFSVGHVNDKITLQKNCKDALGAM